MQFVWCIKNLHRKVLVRGLVKIDLWKMQLNQLLKRLESVFVDFEITIGLYREFYAGPKGNNCLFQPVWFLQNKRVKVY